jgi:hypothetical protein
MIESGDLLLVLLVLFFCVLILAIAVQSAVFRRLQSHHPNEFTSLGEPAIFNPTSEGYGDPKVLRFFGSRLHKSLGDAKLSKLSDIWLTLFVIGWLLLIGIAYLSFA